MKTKMSDEDAIRQVILDGVGGDFCDVARVVSDRFRLDVSSSQVEEIYRQIKEEMAQTASSERALDEKKPIKIGRVGLSMQTDVAKSATPPSGAAPQSGAKVEVGKDPVMAFVEMMGGFDAAKAAITDLEASVKRLLT